MNIFLILHEDWSGLHQFGEKVLARKILRMRIGCGRGIWKGDVLVADIEELENLDASEIRARRLNAKEVLTPKWSENSVFPIADGTEKLFGRDHDVKESTLRRELVRSEDLREELQGNSKGLNRQKLKMTLKPAMTFAHWKETSFIVITPNLESSPTCRKKKHSQFHSSILT